MTQADAKPPVLVAPGISLPRGGGALRGIGEKLAANPVTGTGSTTVPGLGWSLPLPSVTRKTDKGIPQYDDTSESDVFILAADSPLPRGDHALILRASTPPVPYAADPAISLWPRRRGSRW